MYLFHHKSLFTKTILVQENFFTKSPGTVHWFWAPACGPGIRTWVLFPQGVAGFTVYNCKISKYLSGDKLTHHQYFKGTVSRAFKLCFFHDSNPPEPVIHMLKYFRIYRDILHMQKTARCLWQHTVTVTPCCHLQMAQTFLAEHD